MPQRVDVAAPPAGLTAKGQHPQLEARLAGDKLRDKLR
jgi:hypothetical protein